MLSSLAEIRQKKREAAPLPVLDVAADSIHHGSKKEKTTEEIEKSTIIEYKKTMFDELRPATEDGGGRKGSSLCLQGYK
jgi:hypothetical protein